MCQSLFSRRQVLAASGAIGVGLQTGWAQCEEVANQQPEDPATAIKRLVDGNDRFVRNELRPQHVGRQWRSMLTKEQHPYATILGCSYSRVPPELIFDEGFGDLFIMRVAGNVIAEDVMGSLSYAAEHLRTKLFLVLGHESCGAVTAAVDAALGRSKQPEHIESLLKMITPGLKKIDLSLARPKVISAAVEANVRWSMHQVAHCPQVRDAVDAGRAKVAGAVYELESGLVRMLPEPG